MADRVTWSKDGPYRSAIDTRNLPILNGHLASLRYVFVDSRRQLRIKVNKIWHPASMISMPVCEKNVRNIQILIF